MMIAPSEDGAPDFSEMFTLEGVSKLLAKKSAALPCWTHYAAFDLWVGRWIATDAMDRGVPQLLLIPCLFLCMMVGPIGLVAYFLLRLPFSGGKKATASRKSKNS
ncbi:hypothetical protein CHLRE_12g542150v5 [Chlamydomonas reinhardtii]|uniref:DUF4281 domain-containing protein n=1 Tax=Chlamydomonas reinhardtii TaxID=3055 RepID=A0A2K3D6U4_CHLRE|nr:uncharacterized protein CHLRE_12g542150v5 [Chlamydomonas reinhardtii]PNW76247.1 hypothetical protein CHLRE_12g542150v5 [Chlamydomonas reinhardtii]